MLSFWTRLLLLFLVPALIIFWQEAKKLSNWATAVFLLLVTVTVGGYTAVSAYMGPTLSISKDFGGSSSLEVESGSEFTYVITYRCASITQDCTNAVLSDPLPPEVDFVNITAPPGDVQNIGYDGGSHEVTVDFIDPLSAGSTGVVEITVRFPPGTPPGTTAVNNASSSTDGGIETAGPATATASGTFEMFVDKRLAGDSDDGVIGDDFITNYTLHVCSPDDRGGVRLTNPTVVDQLPPKAEFVSASNGGVYDAGSHTITWDNTTLPDPVPVIDGCSINLDVTVRFPENGRDGIPSNADDPQVNDIQTNAMTVTGTPEDGSPDVNLSDDVDVILIAPYFSGDFGKSSDSPSTYVNRPTEELAGGVVNYTVTFENSGTITATNVIVTDTLPVGNEAIVTAIEVPIHTDPVDAFYETVNNPGIWVPFPNNSYAATATVPVTTTTTANPNDIELAFGDRISRIQWNIGTVSYNTAPWSATISTIVDPAVPPGSIYNNCANSTANYVDGSAQSSSSSDCAAARVIETRTIPRVDKTASIVNLLPGQVTEYTIEAYNADVAHNNIVAPITVGDLLPDEMEVVIDDGGGYRAPTPAEISNGDWYTVSSTNGAPPPTHSLIPSFNAQNETLLRWEFAAPYEMPPSDRITITFFARVLDYTPPQQVDNNAILLWDDAATDNALTCDNSDGNNSYTDSDDIDGDANTSETGCQINEPLQVQAFLAMDSEKFVQGNEQTGWKDYDTTVTGGDVDYRMVITNTSNITATNIIVYDIFPHVGDTGTIDSSPRGSEWSPHLIAPITDTQGLPITIAYSRSTNPCRPELIPSGPAGCTNDWSTIPPADITSVKALRFEMCDGGGCLELAPDDGAGGGRFEFEWNMVVPNSAAVGDVAWNSFGFTAQGGTLSLLPSEPIRVGIEVVTNSLPGHSIGDFVWLDIAGQQDDGIQQPEEAGISGVRVELWDASTNTLVDFRTTGPDVSGNPGYYEFINIPDGDYFIRYFQPQDGLNYTFSPGEQGANTAVDSNGTTTGNHATHGDYIQSADFTISGADDYTHDQGMWLATDYGDAPASYPVEAASQANPADAGRHIIVDGIYMGSGVDSETDGQPDANALGDDATDDEDGVTFDQYIGTVAEPSALMTLGEDSTVTIAPVISSPLTTTTTAYLSAWIDFDGNGTWEAGEQVATDVLVTNGVAEDITVSVPSGATAGTTYARFRLSTEQGLAPTGTARDGEVEDYKVQLLSPPEKTIVATSEAHTDGNNTAIGEIVRYHMQISVPEGDAANFVVTDNLPGRLQYLNDGTATIGFTATTTVTWTQFVVTPATFGSSTDPVFDLGTVTNNDADSGEEFIFIEFNVLVLNHANSNAGNNRNNNFTVTYDSYTATSPNVTIRIVEPDIDLTKTLTTTPNDAGDTAVYQLTATNSSAANVESGFDISITDTLDTDLDLQAYSITAPPYALITDTSSIPANQFNIVADRLDPGDSITVVLTATVNTTAAAGDTIPNSGYLLYSSLPVTGTLSNPTGSFTPGDSGDSDGERNGSGGTNDHADVDDAPFDMNEPTIDKQVTPTTYTIGENVTYNVIVTLPEGTTVDLDFADNLPVGLEYVSHQIIETAAASGGLLAADYNGTLPAPTANSPSGSGTDLTLDFGDTTTAGDNVANNNSFLVRITAVILNELGNQDGDTLNNIATISYTANGGTQSQNDNINITLEEPVLAIDKQLQAPIPTTLDAGTVITYAITIDHPSATTPDAFDVVVTDSFPAELTNVTVQSVTGSGVPDPTFDLAGNDLRVPDSGSFDLPQGASVTIIVSAEIGGTAVPGQTINNTAGVTWSTLDGTPAEERDGGGDPDGSDLLNGGALDDYEVESTESFTVDGTSTTKSLTDTSAAHTSGSDVTIGEIVTYTIALTVPEGTVPSLTITDDLPIGLTYVAGSLSVDDSSFAGTLPAPTVSNGGSSGDDLIISYGSFTNPGDNNPANNSFTLTYAAVVNDIAGNVGLNPPGQTDLTNGAEVQIGSGTPETVTPVTVTVVEPRLEISKAFNTEIASPNDTITVTLIVTNTGTSAAFDVIVEDPLNNSELSNISEGTTPAGFTFSTNASGGTTEVIYTGGTIPAGSSVTFTFQADIVGSVPPSPPDLLNVATVTQATTLDSTIYDGDDSEERDEPDVNDSDTLTIVKPDLVLVKDDGETLVEPGQQITYTLNVTNAGGATATGVTITDTVPANTTFAGTAGWVCAPDNSAGSVCTYAVGTLADSGGNTAVPFSIIIDDPLPNFTAAITNTAVTADDGSKGPDPTPANNTDDDVDTVAASIGDFVWLDINGNGIQDGGTEVGINNVTVVLYDVTNTPILTATTDGTGFYSFTGLIPDDYTVRVIPPAGYTISPQNQGGNDADDSDIDPATGFATQTNLAAGENDPTWDAGLYIPASLGDFIWYDLDNDGEQDGGAEVGLYNVTVDLYDGDDNFITTTTTNASGYYSFTNLAPNDYYIEVTIPAGYAASPQDNIGNDAADSDIDPTGQSTTVTLASGDSNMTLDGGLYAPPASIGDYVWLDANQDGDQDGDEYGVGGVTVDLYDFAGNAISTTITAVDGSYGFINLPPGDYYVDVTPPAGYTITGQDLGGNDALDSDIDDTTGETIVTTLDPSEDDPTWDAGLYIDPASIGDFVWLDADQDGVQDAGEYGIPNVTVDLYDDNDNLIATTTTAFDGSYLFDNLPPGDYYLDFTTPAGYSTVPQDAGGDDGLDSDYDPTTGETAVTTLDPNENDDSWDAGYYIPPASIGDYIWLDADQDGIQDGNESGIGGVQVDLYDGSGNLIDRTTTLGNGSYSFDGLPPGDYYIDVIPPAGGYIIVAQDAGGDDTRDSDIDDITGQSATTTLTSGENDTSWDGGLYVPPAALGDYVWLDADQDGVQDANEYGINGVTVDLYDSADTLISTTTTNASGYYTFTNLSPGDYYIDVTPPLTYTITTQDVGDDALDSDINIATGESVTTTLVSGENDPTWDAGLYMPPASIGDFIWLDADQDGVQDADEYGIEGVTVELHNGAGTLISTTTTDGNGGYSFTNLPPDDYYIVVTPSGGYTIAPQDAGGDDALDSDIDGAGQTVTTTLVSGENDTSWDGGLYIDPASIGDYVWLDANQDGVQDADEYGIEGVTVNLYDDNDTLIGTTTTDALGGYGFTNLPPGDYYIEVVEPAGYTVTLQDNAGDDALDSDIDNVTGQTVQTNLVSGENDPDWDGGLYIDPASLSNYVWLDANQDGIQDNDELGIPNVTVELFDDGGISLGTTTTDANGFYSFDNLPPADYYLEFTTPAAYSTVPQDNAGNDTLDSDYDVATGQTVTTTLTANEDDDSWDAGYYIPPASIGDYVWLDADLNGVQDDDESGVLGVIVALYDSSGNLVDSTSTDGTGFYEFINLPPGDYYIEVQLPPNHIFTDQDIGGDDALDSDVDVTTGQTIVTTLVSSENDPSWDAGLVPTVARLGDRVWEDLDGDGVQDVSEPGIGGVTVVLYDVTNTPILTTTTDANGFYEFDRLAPGDYYVAFTLPAGYDFTQQDQGGDDTLDSDADITTGQTIPTTLDTGENDPSWDAGLVRQLDPTLAHLGNYVWLDADSDGIQDVGEPSVAGVTVTLYLSSTGVLSTTTTDANGLYEFINLAPDDYYVEFELPAGFGFTQQDQGGDDAADSDADTATGQTVPTNLVAGENDITWDAGIVQQLNPALAAIGDYVWYDSDRDGVQDIGESGIISVTVNLYDSNGVLTGTTVTDGNGRYQFIDLTPSDYYVEFVPPAGHIISPQNQGADDGADSDAEPSPFSPVYGQTEMTTLVAGENDPSWDAGMYRPSAPTTASLGDYVWEDVDADGVQDIGESGIISVTVNLYNDLGTLIDTTLTDPSGYYSFTNLLPGEYYVEFITPDGYELTYQDSAGNDIDDSDADPATGLTIPTTLTAGENDPSWDAGMYQAVRLGNQVWNDENNDGIFDSGSEAGVDGVILELLDGSSNPVLSPATGLPITTTTSVTGTYAFEGIPEGTYIVRVSEESFDDWDDPLYGFVSSLNEQSPDPATDPDADDTDSDDNGLNNPDPSNGGIESHPVDVALGGEPSTDAADEDGAYDDDDSNLTVDFGFFELLTLGNYVWFDDDQDGQIDAGEAGAAGVIVNLLDGNGDPVLHPVTTLPITTTTDSDGFYQFTNLYPGEYIIEIDPVNFQPGGALEGYWSSEGFVDPDDNRSDTDDNGVDEDEPWIYGIRTQPIRLDYDAEPDGGDDTDDNDNTDLTVDLGFVAVPTAVTLTSFTATHLGDSNVRIDWVTETEIDSFGFRLYRSTANDFSTATEIHFEPSAVAGGTGSGAAYSYTDSSAPSGTVFYWLVDVETDGNTAVHGPITVRVSQLVEIYLPLVISP